jgi:hypothetical protein
MRRMQQLFYESLLRFRVFYTPKPYFRGFYIREGAALGKSDGKTRLFREKLLRNVPAFRPFERV